MSDKFSSIQGRSGLKRRHVTIIVVPHGSSKIRSYRLPVAWLASMAVIALVLLIFAFSMAGSSLNSMLGRNTLSRSPHERAALRSKLKTISGTVRELRDMLTKNTEFEKKARVLADLEPIDDDVRQMGVGGPESGVLETYRITDPVAAGDIKETEIELDELIRQTRLQTESLTEVVTKLEERKILWDHTPSICPVPGGFRSSGFGERIDPFTGSRSSHEGIDICAPVGTPILATADGTVIFASRHAGYGLTLGIDHGHGLTTWYAHLGEIKVNKGQLVKRNQVVASVGTSGRVTAPHVHYEVRTNLKPVDPDQYILPAGIVVD